MNKLDRILETLRNELESGHYRIGDNFPSQYDLALRFDVNPKTANKAVSLLAAEGLLERQRRGQGTRVRAVHTLNRKSAIVFLGPLSTEYSVQALNGIQARAMKENIFTIYSTPMPQDLPEVLDKLENSGIRGIITTGYGKIQGRDIPIVYMDPPFVSSRCSCVTGENYQGGRDIVKAFLDRGHRDIISVFCDTVSAKRKQGVIDALKDAGIPDAESRICSTLNYGIYETRLALKKLQKRFPRYTAVIAGTDLIALDVFRLLPELAPEKAGRIGLSGFGNLSGVNDLIAMATVDQHPFQMGVAAAEMLFRLSNDKSRKSETEYIPMEVIRADNIPIIRNR